MKIIVENVRTFSGRHEINIPPITFLIGENSAGKTTLMNAISVVSNPATFPLKPDFNQPPYEMGNFNNIVTQRKGKAGNSREFVLGYSKLYIRGVIASIIASYEDNGGIPIATKIDLIIGRSNISLTKKEGKYSCETNIEGIDNFKFDVPLPDSRLLQGFHVNELISMMMRGILRDSRENGEESTEKFEKFIEQNRRLYTAFPSQAFSVRKVISLAPIRSKPKRTYDEFKEEFSPEGGHIPFLISRILSDDKLNDEFISVLKEYGQNSGLFDSIRTKRLGNSHSDPFQILVKKGSRESNIVDVGYGVSQVLPIVAECISVGDGTRILMQQPEVHLHPRAQAALGNLISILSNRKKQHYVIETHSDYLIDRIRYETIRKSIKSKDVGIIYLEKEKTDTKVFQIGLDSDGNVMNAPESYREFFIREQFRLLGLEETV